MFCCFRKNEIVFKPGDLIDVRLAGGDLPSLPCCWSKIIPSGKGEFRRWMEMPGVRLGEVEADEVASMDQGKGGIWAGLPLESCLSAVVLPPEKNVDGTFFHPVNLFTRCAPELSSYLKTDQYPLVGRLAGNLVFKRSHRDFVLRAGHPQTQTA